MKKLFTILTLVCFTTIAFAASGIFQSYVVLDIDGAGDAYLAGGINADGAPAYTGAALGTPTSLILNGGENKTYKNGGSNVTGAELNYRVYLQGSPAPGFTPVNIPYNSELGGGDQKWQEAAAGIDILSMATSNGTWVLEVFWKVSSSDGDHYDGNGGANFINTFEVVILPVELTSISVYAEGKSAVLSWETASEIENDFFEIERSEDGVQFESLGSIQGAGNSTEILNYSFTDERPLSGTSYYRLKQVDFNGNYEYSDVVKLEYTATIKTEIYPTAVSTELTLELEVDFSSNIRTEIFNMQGTRMSSVEMAVSEGNNVLNIKIENLEAAMYVINIIDENGKIIATHRFIKL